ncbi:hypothetical protein conserved [Leishmania donovani]|uniref:Uncharacterized protein n=3 Tax=Leishmania donovani species complex TaxID=38574 RepID=A4HRX2_LEIIN|nr:conserved hypothetical protein [Leishmania infantum JPCM5]CAJ1985829.1 hypothetical protein conserved [Leishmania donovani]CAM60035.1 conserved hypothetical protein [Leishmania infantum JPCM5]VDZ41733.1 hypothetical_protein_conserved [Leishmania donovani]|eukprot:XP_001462814.1 conserved hypothetical protein [Leishmania infantum JPCM5]
MKSSRSHVSSSPPRERPLPSSSAEPGAAGDPAATATAAATSLLSRLQRVATTGSHAAVEDAELSELPLLWAAIESSVSMATAAALSSCAPSSASTSPVAVADTLHEGPHARFITETTAMLWGGDYPSWMVQQWVRLGDVEDDEEDGSTDEAAVAVEPGGSSATGVANVETAAATALGREEIEGTHGESFVEPQLSGQGAHLPHPPPSRHSEAERVEAAASAVVSSSNAPVPVPSPSWTFMMQQALEALQLRLPLHHDYPPPQLQLASTGEAPVTTLAEHLVQDAPLLWLRYLLVPMYTQWTQQRAAAPPAVGAAATTTTAPIPSSSSSRSATTVLERDGSVTMHELLGALGKASVREALRKEQSWSDDLVQLVAAAAAAPPSDASATLKALNGRQAAMRDQQRQHTGEMLYFTGALAKAAQSFMVLGQGGYAILACLIIRLLGRARAAWAEWASSLTEADVQRAAQVVYRCGGHETRADCDSSSSSSVMAEDNAEEKAPAEKRIRVEPPPRRSAPRSGVPRITAVESFAALRAAVSSAAQRQAHLVWRCWYVLHGYYGADLYTSEVLARALEEEDLEKAGVRRLAAAQQAHWRRLRLAADVKQHALSETHWLWCSTLLASVETTLMAALSEKRADEHAPVGACATELLYRRLLEGTVRAFTAELRDTLRVYGEAALALRSGGLHSSTFTVPSALQTVAHNVVALQDAFSQCLAASLEHAPAAAMGPHQRKSGLHTQAGVYLWQLYPTLLRVQVPEEASWMSTTGTEQAGDTLGASGSAEVAAGSFSAQFHRHWQRRGRHLSAVMTDAFHCMEQALTHGRRRATSPSLLPLSSSTAAPITATAPVSKTCDGSGGASDDVRGRNDADDGAATARFLAALVHSPAGEFAASSSSASNDTWTAALCDIAADFYAVYDQSCFFILRPERQRLFTLSVRRLYHLLMGPPDGSSAGSSPSRAAASRSATKTTPPPPQQPLVCLLRRDTRLWMLLTHGVLLQLERRGRVAREDEALLASYLLPLMTLLGSRQHDGEVERGSADRSLPYIATEASPVWADTAVAEDILLLLASGLASLPWNLEEVYVTVQRHTALCLRHCTRHQGRLSANGAATVTEMAAWFGAAELASTSAPPASSATAVASPWDFSGLAEVGSLAARSGGGAAALARETAQIDAQCRRDNPLLAHRGDEAASAFAAADAHNPTLTALPCLSEDAMDARFAAALARHGRLASASLASAPCGLLMVVGAYRSCGRALHGLRAALEEQHRMAREDEVGEFVGRTVTFCTSEDITAFRALVTTVHSCVFGYACQPRGLLRLWLGYLQHLFDCVVPRSSASSSSGDPLCTEGEDTLVLMPSSWQRRHHITTLFGARVHRTGWRALQHDGEPASQTRLREVLGECLANLMLLPYSHTRGDADRSENDAAMSTVASEHKGAAAATQAILQRTLPHTVLEILCELLRIPVEGNRDSASYREKVAAVDAGGKAIEKSFLGLAGLLAFLRRLELLVVPGSLQDRRLVHMLRRVYEAADAAALGI